MKKDNIVLIGMPGAGKSTVGVVLAKKLGKRFVDSDLVIQESYGKLLHELIEEYGLESRSMLNSFSDRVLEHLYKKHGHRFPLHGQGIHNCPKTCDHAEIPEEEIYDWCCMYANDPKGGFNCLGYPENFAYCVEKGIKPCVCIADTVENYSKAIEYGCRMFTSNDIYAADAVLRELGER